MTATNPYFDSTVEGFAVAWPIKRGNLTGDDDPNWPVRVFPTQRGAKSWMSRQSKELHETVDESNQWVPFSVSNRGAGWCVLLPVVGFAGRFAEASILLQTDSFGVPDPIWPNQAERNWVALVEQGQSELDGDVVLGQGWRYPEVLERVNEFRVRAADVVEQLRGELGLLEESFKVIHQKFPPPVFWSSRQVCESLLISARIHRSPWHSVTSMSQLFEWKGDTDYGADDLAWNAFKWAVRVARVFTLREIAKTPDNAAVPGDRPMLADEDASADDKNAAKTPTATGSTPSPDVFDSAKNLDTSPAPPMNRRSQLNAYKALVLRKTKTSITNDQVLNKIGYASSSRTELYKYLNRKPGFPDDCRLDTKLRDLYEQGEKPWL